MTRLQTTLTLLVILAAVLAASLAALGWLEFAHNWPVVVPEGARDCLSWSWHNVAETGAAGFVRCLP